MIAELTYSVIIAIVLAVIIYLGYLGRTRKFEEYTVAGRMIPGWAAALAALAATASAATMQSGTGICYLGGLTIAFSFALVHVLFYPMAGFLGNRVTKAGEALNVHTMPEYFRARFEDAKSIQGWLGLITGILLFIYISQIYVLVGLLTGVYFHVPYWIGIVIMFIITAIYVILGGAKSTAFGNAFMGAIIVVALAGLIGSIWAIKSPWGLLDEIWHSPFKDMAFGYKPAIPAPLIWNIVVPLGMIPLFMPHVVQSWFTMKKKSVDRLKSSLTMLISVTVVYFIGFFFSVLLIAPSILGASFLKPHPELPGRAIDWAVPFFLTHFSNPAIAGLFAAGVMAAAISTAGAGALVSSFGFIHDLGRLVKPNITPQGEMKAINTLIFIELLAAIFLSMFPIGIVAVVVSYIALLFEAAVLFQFWGSLYWKGATKAGVLWSSIIAFIITAIWGVSFGLYGTKGLTLSPFPFLGALYVGLPVSLVLFFGISAVTKKPSEEILKKLFG